MLIFRLKEFAVLSWHEQFLAAWDEVIVTGTAVVEHATFCDEMAKKVNPHG